MRFNPSFVVRDDIPVEYLCTSCRHLVYPDSAVKAPCLHLICSTCKPRLEKCQCPEGRNKLLTRSNCQTIDGDPCSKKIWQVFVHCENRKEGCLWTGTMSEYATTHRAFCLWGLPGFDKKEQQAKDLLTTKTTKEMAKMYRHASFTWSWQNEFIDGQSVLSDVKIQLKGMCAFFATASVFEANLRLKGHRVKLLSWRHLFRDYLEETKRLKALKVQESRLITIARILERKGMLELSADGKPIQPEKRHKIERFKKFNMITAEGVSEAVDHIHDHGPIICVHGVSQYHGGRNAKSAGVIHTVEDKLSFSSGSGGVDDETEEDEDVLMTHADVLSLLTTRAGALTTHAVCTSGMGSEDLTSFFSYQNSMGVSYQNEGFGRVLAHSVLEAVGLFCYENQERLSKRAKVSRHF